MNHLQQVDTVSKELAKTIRRHMRTHDPADANKAVTLKEELFASLDGRNPMKKQPTVTWGDMIKESKYWIGEDATAGYNEKMGVILPENFIKESAFPLSSRLDPASGMTWKSIYPSAPKAFEALKKMGFKWAIGPQDPQAPLYVSVDKKNWYSAPEGYSFGNEFDAE